MNFNLINEISEKNKEINSLKNGFERIQKLLKSNKLLCKGTNIQEECYNSVAFLVKKFLKNEQILSDMMFK